MVNLLFPSFFLFLVLFFKGVAEMGEVEKIRSLMV